MKTNAAFCFLALVFLFPTAAHAALGDEYAKLTPNDASVEGQFGNSVGMSGNMAIIGAYNDDDNGNYSGSAYLFDVASGSQLAKLTPNDGAADDYFGGSVGMSGNRAIVGAWLLHQINNDAIRVYFTATNSERFAGDVQYSSQLFLVGPYGVEPMLDFVLVGEAADGDQKWLKATGRNWLLGGHAKCLSVVDPPRAACRARAS